MSQTTNEDVYCAQQQIPYDLAMVLTSEIERIRTESQSQMQQLHTQYQTELRNLKEELLTAQLSNHGSFRSPKNHNEKTPKPEKLSVEMQTRSSGNQPSYQ